MSGRRHSRPVVPFEVSDSKETWSENDKKMLLTALKMYGHTDYSNIAKMLPGKSFGAVKTMLHNTMLNARRTDKFYTPPPIEEWIECTPVIGVDTLIPQALLFISMFERHPPPEQCAGADFSAAYDFLYRMCLGHPSIDLGHKTKSAIYNSIRKMIDRVRPTYRHGLMKNINVMPLQKTDSSKVYSFSRRSSKVMGTYDVLGLRDINPFLMPTDITHPQHNDSSEEAN